MTTDTDTTETFRATFARLRGGDWGVRVVGTLPREGSEVPVYKRSGRATRKTLGQIVWRGAEDDGTPVALYTIAEDRPGRAARAVRDDRRPMPPAAPEDPAEREQARLRAALDETKRERDSWRERAQAEQASRERTTRELRRTTEDVQRLTFALEYVLRSERDFNRDRGATDGGFLPDAVRAAVRAALGEDAPEVVRALPREPEPRPHVVEAPARAAGDDECPF